MRSVLAFLAALAIFGAALPAAAQAAGKDPAQSAFSEGIDHYQAGRYERALEAFQEAYEIKPTWRLLYNHAQCYAMLNRHGQALTAFEAYLAQGGDEVVEGRREEVLGEIQRLRAMVGTVEIGGEDGDRVVVNGVDRGSLPEASRVKVEMGTVSVVVKRGGQAVLERKFQLSGQETVALAVGAQAEAAAASTPAEPAASTPAEPAAEPATAPKRVWTWVALGVAGAAAIGGGVAGGIALKRETELRDACDGASCDPALEEDGDAIRPAALAADVLFGVAAAAAVTGIILFFAEGRGEKPAAVEVGLAPSPNGVALSAGRRF